MAFVHLQTHSEFSVLQASARLDDILAAAAKDNAPAIALTDHGAMFGILEFQTRGQGLNKKRKGDGQPPLKTLYGCHVYIDTPSATSKDNLTYERLTLLVENEKGYYNLLRIVSYRYEDGDRWAEIPSVPLETVEEFKEGILPSQVTFSVSTVKVLPQVVIPLPANTWKVSIRFSITTICISGCAITVFLNKNW